jgi:Reverse transcriptase (RNA-dependent DNA polymerase)
MDITLAGLSWKICLVYLDDIIIFSITKEKHLEHMDAVLHRLYRAGLSLNLKKRYFLGDTVSYLGHVICPGNLIVAKKNTHALKTANRRPHKASFVPSLACATCIVALLRVSPRSRHH